MKSDLKVVKLHGESKEPLGTLFDRLHQVINDYALFVKDTEDRSATTSEVLGTIEVLKHNILNKHP